MILYDPSTISYLTLLDLFWGNCDPHAKPFKRQYATAVFYHDNEQKMLASEFFKKKRNTSRKDIQAELLAAGKFHIAENYHQKYLLRQHQPLLSSLKFKSDEELRDSTIAARINGYLAGYGHSAFDATTWKKETESLGLDSYVTAEVLKYVTGEKSITQSCGL